jgi:hypothetical protein
MFKHRRKNRLIVAFVILIILAGILFLPVIYSLSDKLSETERVNANVLLVEGWLPHYAIRMATDEFRKNGYEHIIATGLKSTPDYFNVYSNGSLVFYTSGTHLTDSVIANHTIGIKASSSLNGENRARFNVLLNDSLAGNFIADKRKRNYNVTWVGRLSAIDSVSVRFLNDRVGDFGDRNLFVKEIILDNKISIPYQLNSIYSYSESDRTVKIKNDYTSYAELARNSLLAMGIDSSLVVEIPGKKVTLNRTLCSALAFKDWLKKSDIKIKGINIVTLGTHARRSLMIYNKILDKKYTIGIISLPDYKEQYSRKYKVLKTIRETIGIIYYWFILIPY